MQRKEMLKLLLQMQRIRHQIAYRLRRFGYCIETGDFTPLDREQRKSPPIVMWYKP